MLFGKSYFSPLSIRQSTNTFQNAKTGLKHGIDLNVRFLIGRENYRLSSLTVLGRGPHQCTRGFWECPPDRASKVKNETLRISMESKESKQRQLVE